MTVFFLSGRRIQTSPLLCQCLLNHFSKQQSAHRIKNSKPRSEILCNCYHFKGKRNQTLGKLGFDCITEVSLFAYFDIFLHSVGLKCDRRLLAFFYSPLASNWIAQTPHQNSESSHLCLLLINMCMLYNRSCYVCVQSFICMDTFGHVQHCPTLYIHITLMYTDSLK